MELENLNIQAIAKWFERGCDTNEAELINNNKNGGDDGYHILECNDICLLSKLPDVKNKTLLDRAHKRLKTINDPYHRKDFLITIINEFLRDSRKIIALKMINNEIENETEMFKQFEPDLLFHRALCYFKMNKPTEALIDLYSTLEHTKIRTIDRIHVQILEEIQKYLKNNKLTEEHVVIKDSYRITLREILKQYEMEVCRFCEEQKQAQEKEQKRINEQQQFWERESNNHNNNNNNNKHHKQNQEYYLNNGDCEETMSGIDHWELPQQPYNNDSNPNQHSILSSTVINKSTAQSKQKPRFPITYKSKLIVNSRNNKISEKLIQKRPPLVNVRNFRNNTDTITAHNNKANRCGVDDELLGSNHNVTVNRIKSEHGQYGGNVSESSRELNLTYSVDNQTKKITVKQILNEPIIDNIFHLKAILVDNLCDDYKINTIYEIFEKFGRIVNIRHKDNTKKLIIEYDNVESPRDCISYLSQVELPSVSQPYKYLEFRFYKSESQKDFRICKQNQTRTSRECYFWRTTGCQNFNCKFYHNRLAKGVDYQEWMRISEHINNSNNNNQNYGATRIITNKTVANSSHNLYGKHMVDQNKVISKYKTPYLCENKR